MSFCFTIFPPAWFSFFWSRTALFFFLKVISAPSVGLELRPCEIKFHDFPVEPSRSPCLFVFIEDFIEVVFFFFWMKLYMLWMLHFQVFFPHCFPFLQSDGDLENSGIYITDFSVKLALKYLGITVIESILFF